MIPRNLIFSHQDYRTAAIITGVAIDYLRNLIITSFDQFKLSLHFHVLTVIIHTVDIDQFSHLQCDATAHNLRQKVTRT